MRSTPTMLSPGFSLFGWGAFVAVSLWLGTSSGMGQQLEERRRIDEILRPRTDMPFRDTSRKTNTIKTFDPGESARVKTFSMLNPFRSKEYAAAAYDRTNAWSGQTLYETRNANLRARSKEDRLVKNYSVRDYDASSSTYLERQLAKDPNAKTYAEAGKTNRFRGKSQDKIDIYGPAAMATINSDGTFTEIKTMDDVRNLLNELSTPASLRQPKKK